MRIALLLLFATQIANAQVKYNPWTRKLDYVGATTVNVAFSTMTSGTNTIMAGVVGSGASLGTSGTGTITATSLGAYKAPYTVTNLAITGGTPEVITHNLGTTTIHCTLVDHTTKEETQVKCVGTTTNTATITTVADQTFDVRIW